MPIIKNKTFIFLVTTKGCVKERESRLRSRYRPDNARLGILAGGNTTDGREPHARKEANGAKAQTLPLDKQLFALMIQPRECWQCFPHGNGAVSGDRAQFINSALQIVPEDFFTVRGRSQDFSE